MTEKKQKREDFPIDSFLHLENRLQNLRLKILKRAAEIAKEESGPEEDVFLVSRMDVDEAFYELVPDA